MKSIAFKLWSGMMLLVVIVLILLWLFQIVFLENFYINQRVDEVKDKGLSLLQDVGSLDRDTLIEKLESLAYDYNCSIDLLGTDGSTLYSTGVGGMRMPMMGRNYMRSDLFEKVLAGETVTTPATHPRFNSSYMLIGLPIHFNGEVTGAMLINMPLAPVEDTAQILKKQLIYICLILLFASLLLSYFLSRTFIKPILNITRAAGEMASGNLSVKLEAKSKDEIGKLSLAINHLGAELSKIEHLRRDFIANVSHELRTPLSLIRGYAETIKDVTGENRDKRERQLGIIIEESERLGKIVDDILDLTQIQSDKLVLKNSVFNLNNTIQAVVNKYSLLSEQIGVKINYDSSENILAEADEARIEQVLYNLINNALNHSKPDSLITIETSSIDEKIRIEVSDEGEGIPKEDINYIWERYYKSDKSSGRKRIGTGLGLAIVKNILESHKSSFGVNSVLGEGTTFWFEIKLSK